MKGKFIVIEGPDGSGKSTVARSILEYFQEKAIPMIHTREPGGTPVGEEIRNLLLDPENKEIHPRTEALLYAASRAQHVEEKIRLHLEKGVHVLCERFVFSSLVYQGMARDMGIDNIQTINDFATSDVKPDLILYLDPKEKITRDRIQERPLDRLELEEEFTQSVQANYRILAQKMQEQLHFVDATQSPEEVLKDCLEEMIKELEV